MGDGSEHITTVTINNQTYRVRSAGDPDYVHRLASYVDGRMREVFGQTQTVDTLRVAILTALNIADDYFSTQRELAALEEVVSQKSTKMIDLLEPFLGSSSP